VILLGGEPHYLHGFAVDRNMEDAASGADIVVVIKPNVSHANLEKAKLVAKDKGRLFYSTSRENWSGLRKLFEQEIIPAWNARVDTAAD
jgi:hypothetical protein